MDLNYSPEEEEFRLKVRLWLDENLPKSRLRGEARMRLVCAAVYFRKRSTS